MLTTDLIRARISKGEIVPRFLKADDKSLGRAETLLACFDSHVGKTRGELEEAILAEIGDGTDYLVWNGLAKLLYDRSEFAVDSPIACEDLRRAIFEEGAKHHPVIRGERYDLPGALREATRRDELLRIVSERLQMTSAALEQAMYADLEEAHKLVSFEKISAEELIDRYNVALVQSILLRATELRALVWPDKPSRLRQLFRFIKFFRLMYRVAPRSDGSYLITLDGPLSIFKQSQKYGVQLACFFPALLLCPKFSLEADIVWSKEQQRLAFAIDDRAGLVSHYQDTGHYVSEEGRWLEERWAQLKLPWALDKEAPPINLRGRLVMVPDYTIRAPDGREAYVELVGFWRKGYLETRLSLLREAGPPNLILAISDRLRVADEEAQTGQARILWYKGTIVAKDLLAMAESCAVKPSAVPT
jgi:predicted nuclease of restriction endonuclease-like RecB superfamily